MSNGKGWHGDKKRHSMASKKGWKERRFDNVLASATGGKGGLSVDMGKSPDYYRPTSELIGVDKIEEFRAGLEKDGFKKTSRYTLSNIQKRTGSPTGFEKSVLNTKDRMFYDHIITDKKGKIPEKQGILRLQDVESGGERGRRNILVDLGETAKKVYKQDEKGNWHWYIHPNKSDIENIDTDYSSYAKSYDKLKQGKLKGQKGIVIMARTPEEEKDMRKRIGQAFTQKEQKEMGLVFISVEPTPPNTAGVYFPTARPPQVKIKPSFKDNADVLIHELTHHHRAVGKSREGALKHVRKYEGRDRDLEESMTDAEGVAREKPFDKKAGYYQFLKYDSEKDKKVAEFEDRSLLTGYETTTAKKRFGELDKDKKGIIESSKENKEKLSKKNVRGIRAIRKVEKEYPETNISKLKIKGKAEAIDTFHEYQKGKGKIKIQSYNPTGKKAKAPVIRGLGKKGMYEWKDGKKVKVR